MTSLNERTKRVDTFDISLIKLASAAGILVILKLWSSAMTFVQNTSIWWFVVALVVLAARPFLKWIK